MSGQPHQRRVVHTDVATLLSPEPLPSLLYHLAALGLCLFTQSWSFSLAPLTFLVLMFTIWTGLVQTLYFLAYMAAALLSYCLPPSPSISALSTPLSPTWLVARLRQLTSLLMSSMALCTFGTAVVFWSVYSYDPTLMVPADFRYDIRLNHLQHSVPLALSIIELLAFPHPNMPVWLDFGSTLLVPAVYMALLCLLLSQKALPYVFMERFELWHLLTFIATLMALATASYTLYARIRAWRWREAKHGENKYS